MKLELFLMFSVALTMLLFITQTTMDNVVLEMGDDPATFFNYDDSHIKQFDEGNFTITSDYTTGLPSTNQEISDGDSGNIFTDTFKVVKDWVLTTTGLKYVIDVLNAVPNFLKQLFGSEFAEIGFALGYFWHIISFIVFIAWIRGVTG